MLSFFPKVWDFVKRPTHSRIMALLVMLVLVSAVYLTVIVAHQQQTIKQRASFNACTPPYQTLMGCYAEDNLPYPSSDPRCTGSCTVTTADEYPGNPGKYCYESTVVGQSCVTDSGQTGICDIYGDCNAPSSEGTYLCNDGIVCQGTCIARDTDPNRCYEGNGNQTNCEYTTYNKDHDQCIRTATRDQPCTVQCSAGKECLSGTCVDSVISIPEPTVETPISITQIPSPSPFPTIPSIQATSMPTAAPTDTNSFLSPYSSISLTPTPFCSLHNKGDANCDGIIDMVDYGIWQNEMMRQHLGTLTQHISDFNDDGIINIEDFNIWENSRLLSL